jgi:uncharacterized protein (TIGR00369 family)
MFSVGGWVAFRIPNSEYRICFRQGDVAEDHFERLERMYLAAPCNAIYRPTIAVRRGEAEISFDVGPHLHHAGRAVHGASYFKALDDAAFFAVGSLVDDVFVLTVSFTVYLLRPISEGTMVARGTVVSESRNLWVAESVVEDGESRALGRGSGTFMRSRTLLGDALGYGDVG